jgi:hypothetical protein
MLIPLYERPISDFVAGALSIEEHYGKPLYILRDPQGIFIAAAPHTDMGLALLHRYSYDLDTGLLLLKEAQTPDT